MVSTPGSPSGQGAPFSGKTSPPAAWLVPGEDHWEIWRTGLSGNVEERTAAQGDWPPGVTWAALPCSLVACQLFWLETTDEKAVPDLLRMQCERRMLLRQGEVWSHRILRRESERLLVQVLILQNAVPPVMDGEGLLHFEAQARCLGWPPRTLGLWRSLGRLCLALADDSGVLYFQALPHGDLTPQALGDIREVLWAAEGQNWMPHLEGVVLLGNWSSPSLPHLETALGMAVRIHPLDRLTPPAGPMELIPRSVVRRRAARARQYRIKLVILALAALYLIFVAAQGVTYFWSSRAKNQLQSRLDSLLPAVQGMQNTARRLEALNPALDVNTYPLEVLYRVMSVLPEKGVRLTAFDIIGDRLELAGESTTAREAFDYISALEAAENLGHIQWDEAPQPVPLPNDTTRFSIKGTITGAYHEPEES